MRRKCSPVARIQMNFPIVNSSYTFIPKIETVIYVIETKAKGSTRYRNPRGSHIEHEREGSMATRGFLYRVDPVGRGL